MFVIMYAVAGKESVMEAESRPKTAKSADVSLK